MAQHRPADEGPRPFLILVAIILILLALGALFAAIRLFLAPSLAVVREQGSIDAVFCRTADCEQALVGWIANATDVRCAFYELDLNRTAMALNNVGASVLIFDENLERAKRTGLVAIGVPSAGLMHDKFCVLDDWGVVTGSMNPTVTAQTRNDEHLLFLRSRALNRAYAREWGVLEDRALGGTGKKPRVNAPLVELSGTPVDVCFSPAEGCEADLVAVIDRANASIRFLTFSFTSDEIGDALVRAYDRGVDVSGVVERRQVDKWSEYDALRLVGIPMRKDGNAGTMHHKVFIIDNTTVVTGSFNPTANANTRNDENMLIIQDAMLAREYLEEYERVWRLASS